MEEWEDPHPGQRFPLPPQPEAGLPAGEHEHHYPATRNQTEEFRTSGSGPRSRRGFPFRLRPKPQKHQRIAIASTDLPSQNRTPVVPTHPAPMFICSSSAGVLSTISMQETSSTKTISRSPSCATETATSSEPSLPRPWMEGLPGVGDNEINSGPVAARRVTRQAVALPDDDPYGWEAELDRRTGRSAAEFRGTRDVKRSLLYRVLHLQPTSRHR